MLLAQYKTYIFGLNFFLQVLQKRTNMPGISTTNRPPRGRGFRGRGGFRGGFRGAPRRGVFRGRGSRGGFHAGYAPY